MGCGVVHVLHERRKRRTGKSGMAVLLAAPGITLPKWKTKEIEATIPNVKVNIIRNGNDALALLRKVKAGYKPSTVEFTMVGIDRAKLGSESYFDGIWKRMHTASKREDKLTYAWHCPDCGKPIMVPLDDKKDDEDQLVPAGWDAFAEGVAPTDEDIMEARRNRQLLSNGLPKDWKVKWIRKASIKRSCDNEVALLGESATEDARMLYPISRKCKAQFFRPALKSRGETNIKPRINISQVLKRLKGWFDLFIMDEAHQAKGADSGRGDAFGQMVKSAKRTMMLTGTLTTGKSTSVKELLWRTDPKLLLDAGIDYHTGDIEWATRFGKIEQIIKDDEGDVGVVTRKKKRSITSREAPGIAPQMTAQFLIHKSVFLELTDMGLPLVELKEIPMFLEMDKEHALEYRRFHDTLYDACKIASVRSSGVSGAWSKFNPATLMYASRPELGMTVTLGDGVYEAKPIGTEADSHALERWLIETVQMELADGRGCIIYNQFTGNYGMNERVQTILSRNGIRSQILDEPNPEMRTTRLAEYEEAAVPVIITNMKLVEVGLDMMYWPTIIYNQLSYEVNTVRQSSRRSWRIGQDRECRVYYPIYNGTQKMKQFLHIMSARGHALMVEGRLDKSELAEYSRDSQSSLARDLASCFAGAEVAAAWERLAAKEMEGLEIIAEANFKEVLQQRMKDLADETLRLCGIDPVAWRKEREARKSMPAPTLQTNEEANVVDEEYPLDLFSMLEAAAAKNVTVNEPVPTQEEKREEDAIRIMTFAEAMLEKGKSSRGKKKHVEDQLLWDFGS
ncbi:hypothetical protein [Paenibacillus sp. GXUN7292]|uniref:hypothetical protein n=1 Tax=Paenibacillus sp. GXUN7292 TaxID=3422499 RepID=UPI003D7E4960